MATQPKRHLIEYKIMKPFVDATVLGSGCGAFAIVLDSPPLNWALIGGGLSFFWHWGSANLIQSKPKRPPAARGRHILVNSAKESRNVRIFDQVAPGFITRESYLGGFLKWARGKPRTHSQRVEIDKPKVLDEYIFRSGQIELLEGDVRRFLKAAWRHRHRGSGLGQRRWVRDWQKRPQWYKDLGPIWYYGLLGLLREAQQITRRQMVVELGHQQYGLKFDPHTTLAILKWAEAQKEESRSRHQRRNGFLSVQ